MPRRMILGAAIAWLLAIIFVVVSGIPPLPLLALISATLLVEYAAAAVGIGLGLSPVFLLAFITAIALGIVLTLFAIFDALAATSGRVCSFIERARHKHGQSRILHRYGILSLVPLVIIIGFYFSPPVAWFMGWDRRWSLVLLTTGEIIGILLTLGATLGILRILG